MQLSNDLDSWFERGGDGFGRFPGGFSDGTACDSWMNLDSGVRLVVVSFQHARGPMLRVLLLLPTGSYSFAAGEWPDDESGGARLDQWLRSWGVPVGPPQPQPYPQPYPTVQVQKSHKGFRRA